MIYKFILKCGYHETEFTFTNFTDGCAFMIQALKHIEEDASFIVKTIGEVEECIQNSES